MGYPVETTSFVRSCVSNVGAGGSSVVPGDTQQVHSVLLRNELKSVPQNGLSCPQSCRARLPDACAPDAYLSCVQTKQGERFVTN